MSLQLEHGPVRIDSRSPFTGELLRCDGCGRELDIREVSCPVSTHVRANDYVFKRIEPGSFCSPCANLAGIAASTSELAKR